MEILKFEINHKTLRGISKDNEPWFIAKDVAEMLGYSRPRDAIKDHCKGGVKLPLPSASGIQQYTIIPESDVWRLIIQCTLPQAEKIEKWIMEDVLPQIRKTGKFSINEDPKLLVAHALIAANRIIEEQDSKIAELKPKAEFADYIHDNPRTYSFREAAKLLAFKEIGEKNLFQFCRNELLLMQNNEPYQNFMAQGLFKQVTEKFFKPSNDPSKMGDPAVYLKTVITGKGLDYLSKKLTEKGYSRVREFVLEDAV